jgi:hypothetical protein
LLQTLPNEAFAMMLVKSLIDYELPSRFVFLFVAIFYLFSKAKVL